MRLEIHNRVSDFIWYGQTAEVGRRSTLADRIADHYDGSRYVGLNLHSFFYQNRSMTVPRRTVEFRYFNGTLHAGVVRSNVLLALCMVAKAYNSRSITSRPMEMRATRARYQMRMLMRDLRMVGPVFENPRQHLLHHLPGAGSYRDVIRAEAAEAATASAA